MDEEEMGASMEEWLTARLGLSKPGPWHNSGDRYAQCTTVPADVSWLPKNLDRISGVVHEILTFFDVELAQSDNDKYVAYGATAMVSRSTLHYKKKYGGSLGLPMTLAYHDLLRLTIAYREHGMPIWSGFHKGCTSFSQFDDRGNHMLMETCTSNYAKHDFPVHTYNAIE
ncbi:hypothetical protein VTO58DRAFT_100994 [Aureobasidium pullulans]